MQKSSFGSHVERRDSTDTHHAKYPPLIVLLGPTASGKTELAIRLAKDPELVSGHGFIISADSRQIYRHMDIGTAKPTREQLQTVRHKMIDIVEPDEPFSLAQYQEQVFAILERSAKTAIPFLVGGTGLYIDAITQNWEIPKVAPNAELRQELERLSVSKLANMLITLDPNSATSIDPDNKRRLIRAIEVVETTGVSFIAQKRKRPFPYRVLKLGMEIPREILNTRIVQRVDQMMRDGLLDEAERLSKRYDWNLPAMSGLGYRQLGAYLRGEVTLEQAVERIKIETRQYAKRQMTWFKRDQSIHWVQNARHAELLVRAFLTK